jgi:CheY-like chemotaxis protein
MMGGDVQVDSDVGKGSSFSFEIPVKLVRQSSIINHQSSIHTRVIGLEPGQPYYRLLIVEDDEDSRELLMCILKPMGFQVREAQNGKEAIALWETWQPHLIWMDIRMPVMDGYEATKKIREAEDDRAELRHHRTKIIALTASAFEEDRAKVLETGCDDFVRKPFQETEIFEVLHKYLGVRFVYEESSTVTGNGQKGEEELTPALAALPAEWLTTLEHGAKETNTKRLFEVIEQIRPQNAAVAEVLARLAADFEYDEILALIQQAVIEG